MRYRRLSYRYAEVVTRADTQPLPDLWSIRLPVTLTGAAWRPPADLYETPAAFTVKVELAGVAEDELEIALYADALVVEGVRPWERGDGERRYHTVGIHYGPFRLEVPLRAAINRDRVEARYDRGFLYVTLPKAEVQAP